MLGRPAEFLRPALTGPGGGSGYIPVQVVARSTTDAPVRVGLEQFDLQPEGVPMIGLVEGW